MKTALLALLLLSYAFSFSQFGNPQNLLNTTLDPLRVISSDFDNDGDMDILSSSYDDQKIALYENIGGNQFMPQKVISSSIPDARSIFAADIDGDGDADIIVTSFVNNEISWFENLGDLEFGAQTVVATSVNGISCVHVDDLDGDGDKDILAAAFTDDKIIWFENLGGGSFSAENIISSTADGATHIFSKDVNGDGDADVLSASYNDDKIAWYENLGGGFFSTENIISTTHDGAAYVSSFDFDGDLDNDLIVSSTIDKNVTLYTNDGAGNFTLDDIITTSAIECTNPTYADFDNDGDLDIAVPGFNISGYYQSIIYENNAGSFDTEYQILNHSKSNALAVDIDNDGLMDLMTSGNNQRRIAWKKNLGDLNFGKNLILSTYWGDNDLSGHAVDLDLDGDQDLVFYRTDIIKWYENLGGGVFGAVQRPIGFYEPPYTNMREYLPADIDDDGDIDFIGALYSGGSPGFGWFENDGEQNFSPFQLISSDITVCNGIGFQDLDNDGVKDVLICTNNTDGEVAWFKNLGGGTFGGKNIISTGSELAAVRAIFIADLNNDGKNDVITASANDDKIAWFENLGGTFSSENVISTNADFAKDVYSADFDNDGYMDIVSASRNDNKIAWYRNLGDETFTSEIIIDIEVDDAFFVTGADMNNDGNIDVIATFPFEGAGIVKWYENQGDGTFDSGEILDIGTFSEYAPQYLAVADFDGDDDNEIATFCYGPSSNGVIVINSNFYISEIQISGQVYVDVNENQVFDSLDYYADQIGVVSSPVSAYTFTYSDGSYFMNFEDTSGTYLISSVIPEYWTLSTDSTDYTVVIDTSFTNMDSLDFGLVPDTIINVLSADITGAFPLCSQEVNYWLSIKNDGTTIPSGTIHLKLDDSLNYVSSDVLPDSIVGQNLYWSYDSLLYFDTEQINLVVLMPDFNSIDDTVYSFLEVLVDSLSSSEYSSKDTLWQVVKCAYDPNIKTAIPSGVTDSSFISPSTSSIEYLILFQNTGTDTAFTIVVTDQLLDNIDHSSFEPVSSSDPYTVQISASGLITFTFENIMLPDSNVNEIESHGFVKFNIDLLPGLVHGDIIENEANIYFDSNPPILTPTKTHRIYDCAYFPDADVAYDFPVLTNSYETSYYQWINCADTTNIPGATEQAYEPLAEGAYAIKTSNGFCYSTSDCFIFICDYYPPADISYDYPLLVASYDASSYQWVDCENDSSYIAGATDQTYEPLVNGSYAVITSNGFCSTTSDCFDVSDLSASTHDDKFRIYPNPVDQDLFIETLGKIESLQITDVNGKVFLFNENLNPNGKLTLNVGHLSAGIYILSILTESWKVDELIIIEH